MRARSAARRLTEQKTIDRLSYSLSLSSPLPNASRAAILLAHAEMAREKKKQKVVF